MEQQSEQALKGLTGQFTLSFLKALMMSGIYPADHPVVADITSEPFLYLKKLAPDCNEISFMSASAAVGEEILVEGVLNEGIPFTSLMHSSMGEVFARKFVGYFERNHLVSFAVKTRIPKEELQRLIALFAEWRAREDEGRDNRTATFGQMLVDAGIMHVTAMSREEMVGGERPLPWRVKMAISRLRKDLRLVPLYSSATASELAHAKRMLVQDITRPLRRPQFLKELLANTDLISQGIAEFSDVDMPWEIINCQQTGMLVNVSWDIVADLERASWGAIRQKVGDRERRLDSIFRELLKKIALQLKRTEPETVSELLNHLFSKKILQYADLPDILKQQLLTEKWTDQFLSHKDSVLNRFAGLQEPQTYAEYTRTFRQVFPELIRRELFAEAERMLAALSRHAATASAAMPQRQAQARQLLDELADDAVLERLAAQADTAEKERRLHAMGCLERLGDSGLQVLLDLLAASPVAQVRKDASLAIERCGDEAFVPLMELLAGKGREWFVYRNAILLLARLNCQPAADDIRVFLSHPHRRVREEAVRALARLQGADAALALVPLARDPDSTVARTALAALASLKCRTGNFLNILTDLVRRRRDKEAPVPAEVTLAALDAIAQLGPFRSSAGPIQSVLLPWLDTADSGLLKKLIKKARDGSDDAIRAAVCRTLGAVGDAEALPLLREVLRASDEAVRKVAADAIRSIQSRGG